MQEYHERVGQLLINQELITESQLQEALAMQKERPFLRLGEVLLGLGHLRFEDLNRALELQHRALRLGQLLLRKGVLKEADLEEALTRQQKTGALLGEILIASGYCTEAQIHEALDYQRRHPFYQFAASAAFPGPLPRG